MFSDPLFPTKLIGALLVGLWVGVAAAIAGLVLYHPGDIEEPAYPLMIAEEAEPSDAAPAETAEDTAAPSGDGDDLAALLAAADPQAGAKSARICGACHSFDKGGPNKIGPNLWDIVGRQIGGADGYGYSDALSGMGGEWDYAALDAFLAKPSGFAPGTRMSFAGIKKAEDRANLIVFMREQSDDPRPLP